ncbi:MAG: nuclease-related domain-containing protein [Bacillota bacterium]
MFKKIISLFMSKPTKAATTKAKGNKPSKPKVAPIRIGELGEHKITIQLDQLPKECQHLNDLLIPNPKSRSGYSQVDHLVITPYGIFIIETKNYNGEIKGARTDKYWSVSNRFKMYNPLMQNYGHIKAVELLLSDFNNVKYISMISFTMRCRFSIDPELRKIGSDELIVYDVELSEFIHRKITRQKVEQTSPRFTNEEVISIKNIITKANITDPLIRSQHIEKVKKSN